MLFSKEAIERHPNGRLLFYIHTPRVERIHLSGFVPVCECADVPAHVTCLLFR